MVRLLYILILSIFFSVGGYSQVMQTTGGAGGNKFKALKADSFLVVPKGTDTANLANPKWGESTTGALFVKTTDSTLWFKVGGQWVQAGGNFTQTVIGNDTTIYEFVIDSTGAAANRVLFAGAKKIRSDSHFLWDSVNNKLVINHFNHSIGGVNTKLYVNGNANLNGSATSQQFRVSQIQQVFNDTTNYKPVIVNSSGDLYKLDRWPAGGGGSGTVTSVATGLGLTGGTITTSGTVSLDTANSVVLSRQRAANTYEPIISAPNTANRYWNGYKNFVALNTDSIAEGATNLFYTNARARGAISLTTTGTSGAATYNSTTGVLNIPQYSGGGASTKLGVINAFNTKGANGAVISNDTLYMQTADLNNPGLISTGDQSFNGNKTFDDNILFTSKASGSGPSINFGTNFNQPALVLYDGTGADDWGWGLAPGVNGEMVFYMPAPTSAARKFSFKTSGSITGTELAFISHTNTATNFTVNGSATATGITNNGSMTNDANITFVSKSSGTGGAINFGTNFNYGAIVLYDGGAGGRYGWGLAPNDMQFYIPSTGRKFSWRDGGGFNSGSSRMELTSEGTLSLGTSSPNASSLFHISSTTKGFLQPSMTRAQRVAISSPAEGLSVFDNNSKAHWVNVGGSTTTWGAIYAAQDTVATDASFTLPVYSSFVILPTITTGRTLTIPAAASYENKTIIIKVANSSANAWTVSPAIKDNTDADVTTLTNDKVYTIYSDGTNWHIISLY